jgi:predicted membrane GTPase involved in stress response
VGETVGYMKPEGKMTTGKISELFIFDNLGRTNVQEVDPNHIME